MTLTGPLQIAERSTAIVLLIALMFVIACKSSSVSSSGNQQPLACSGKAAPGIATHLLVGFAGEDSTAAASGFDIRYQYLAGTLANDTSCSPCSNCGTGTSWWGCWQEMNRAPGLFVQRFIATAEQHNLIPMFTYYIILPASGVAEGSSEVLVAARDVAFMTRYFNDFRFFLQKIDTHNAVVHIEPDFWGYAHQAARAASTDAHGLAAAIASANPLDCAAEENSIAGLGRCMISMVRKYSPNTKVGLHASPWGAGYDIVLNTSLSLDVAAQGRNTAAFLMQCGASLGDVIVADMSDRDAGYYQSIGRNTWLDPTDTQLPTFSQVFAWSRSLADASGKPILWWQLPVGNMGLANTVNKWKDNRVDYFFDHPGRVAASGAIGMAFGAGASDQTTPETDNGNLIGHAGSLQRAGGQSLCP